MELAAGARHRPAAPLLPAGSLPGHDRRRASGGIGWVRRATAAGPRLTLLPPPVSRWVAASAASSGRFLPRHVARSSGVGGGGEPRGQDDACSDRSFQTRADPSDGAKDHAAAARLARDHPGGIRKELVNLAVPAIIGQAIDPLAQLLETAYIGRLGQVQLASAAVGVSVFNIVSKLFNIPLLSITTSFVAEDVSRHDSSQFTSGGNISSEAGERKRLTSISSALPPYQNWCPRRLSFDSGVWNTPQHYGCLACINYARCCKAISFYKGTRCSCCCSFFGYSRCLSWVKRYKDTSTLQWYFSMFLLLWSLSKKAVLLPPKVEDLDFVGYIKSGGMLLGRTISVLITMTLATAMAARQGTLAMAAHQICLQVWLAVSLFSDALAVAAQAVIASSFAKLEYERVKEITRYVLKTGVFIGLALGLLLFASFGRLARLFSSDPMVLQIVGSGVLFVSASQPINGLAFIFDGLHFGVSDFLYSASSMMIVGALSSLFLLYAPRVFGLPGIWAGLALFMSLRMAAGFLRLGCRAGPWWFLHQKDLEYKLATL